MQVAHFVGAQERENAKLAEHFWGAFIGATQFMRAAAALELANAADDMLQQLLLQLHRQSRMSGLCCAVDELSAAVHPASLPDALVDAIINCTAVSSQAAELRFDLTAPLFCRSIAPLLPSYIARHASRFCNVRIICRTQQCTSEAQHAMAAWQHLQPSRSWPKRVAVECAAWHWSLRCIHSVVAAGNRSVATAGTCCARAAAAADASTAACAQ